MSAYTCGHARATEQPETCRVCYQRHWQRVRQRAEATAYVASVVPLCPDCGRRFATARGLASHRSQIHGVLSDHPQTARNRVRNPASAVAAVPTYQEGGPFALLTAVVLLARLDARHDREAAAWCEAAGVRR